GKVRKYGNTSIPINAYVIIEKVPSLFPNTSPAKIAKNVCKDTGTVAPPMGTAKNGNQAVTLAPMAIKQTNTAPYVISIVRKRIKFLLSSFYIIKGNLSYVNR